MTNRTPPTANDLPAGWRRVYLHSWDRNGARVTVGTRVRVLAIDGEWLSDFSLWTRRNFLSMVGEVFEVEDVDGLTACARVRKEWDDDDGSHEIRLDLEPREMEVVAEDAR